ncbi:Piso0_004755 [Millerozyma farinosa CBS 7064]|uniref:Piso0_004755 protein n=1 Tax=Pichia sorbitophila (strain ATCC MYA-4447 / BCRC 22081 / CBS 7064 / NBRC 10061 / NRRL Y-12695) TaxID=559304 RepID=G8Y0B9_PICSO|nr:Piso0_004755 [Millerozyma farinosa CBS 7064]
MLITLDNSQSRIAISSNIQGRLDKVKAILTYPEAHIIRMITYSLVLSRYNFSGSHFAFYNLRFSVGSGAQNKDEIKIMIESRSFSYIIRCFRFLSVSSLVYSFSP